MANPPSPEWAIISLRMTLLIAEKEYPVVRASLDFSLNAIPQANVTVASGRDVIAQTTIGDIDSLFAVPDQAAAKLTLEIDIVGTSSGAKNASKIIGATELVNGNNSYVVFEGFTAGVGFQKSQDGAVEYSVQLIHALAGLAYSSALSESSHASNPANYSYGAIAPFPAAGAGVRHVSSIGMSDPFVKASTIREDFWASALLPWFKQLTEFDALFVKEQAGLSAQGKKNDGAATALALLDPKVGLHGRDYKALAVKTDMDADIAALIMTDVSASTVDAGAIANSTIWDMIVGSLAPDYLFAVVPRATDGLVVPFIPGLKPVPEADDVPANFRTIAAADYNVIRIDGNTPRPVRGMGVLSQVTALAGLNDKAFVGVGGYFEGRNTGQVIIQNAPRWMGRIIAPIRHSAKAAGGNLQAIGNANNPGLGAAPANAANLKQTAQQIIKPLLDEYAKALYTIEVTKSRQGQLSGPLRFDIAPGSLVKIETTLDAHTSAPGPVFYANVLRTSIVLDAETPRVGTAFHLGFIRRDSESDKPGFSVDSHPIYTESFHHAQLVVIP